MLEEFFFLEKHKLVVFDGVYPTREDSFLLAKATEVARDSVVLDIGCGTGIQGINALLKGAKKCVFVDVNETALENTKENVRLMGFEKKASFVKSSLFERIRGKFDLVVFNSPYALTEEIRFIDTDGGEGGRNVLNPFLEGLPDFLGEKGKCFFLQSSLNGVTETESLLSGYGVAFKIVAEQNIFFEKLLVFKCWKK